MTRRLVFFVAALLAVVGFVAAAVANRHTVAVQRAKESRLRAELKTMRAALHAYEAKHHIGPRSLSDLVRDGQITTIPVDSVTRKSSTWRTTVEESVRVDDFDATAPRSTAPEIVDIHSGAAGKDSSGRPWADY